MDQSLRHYVRILLQEILDEMKDEIHEDEEKLKEFSAVGAGAIQGVQLPLGMSPDQPIMGSRKRKKPKKRKKPSWT